MTSDAKGTLYGKRVVHRRLALPALPVEEQTTPDADYPHEVLVAARLIYGALYGEGCFLHAGA